MSEKRQSSLQMIVLGSGTSAGVPMIGCDCDTCTSDDPRDHRTRASVLLRYPDPKLAHLASREETAPKSGTPAGAAGFNDQQSGHRQILIDASPDLRLQAIRHRISRLDAVMYTHTHADHVFGTDDLRRFNAVQDEPLDIYAEQTALQALGGMFHYIFQPHTNINKSFIASLLSHPIEEGVTFDLFGATWTPLRLMHGRLPILGFRVDFLGRSLAYCTDVSTIPPETYPLLADLDVLVLDGLRFRHHPTHLTVDKACEIAERLKAKRTLLTHLAHDVKHDEVSEQLPDGVELAHDGLTVTLEGESLAPSR